MHNLHGIPGILGGVAGIVSAAIVESEDNSVFGQPVSFLYSHPSTQAGYQTAILAISVAIGLASGMGTGVILWLMNLAGGYAKAKFFEPLRMFFTDETNWMVPTDFEKSKDPLTEAALAAQEADNPAV
mgnify:FL=1